MTTVLITLSMVSNIADFDIYQNSVIDFLGTWYNINL